jgi:transposase
VGLVIGEEGFPIAHGIFKRNQSDVKSFSYMLDILDKRVKLEENQTSDARCQKDRAIRERFEGMLLKEVEKLRKRIRGGRIKGEGEIQQAIGRLKERYSRVARHYRLEYLSDSKTIVCSLVGDKKKRAEDIDGCYILKTDRSDMDAEEIWRTYMMPTRAESGFRAMKSPLAERPIFHQLQHRVETHIFLCILAYHLLVAIEKTLRDHG